MSYQISIQNASAETTIPDELSFHRWAAAALKPHCDDAELCIRVVDREESQQLNLQYRKKDKPTNVLSFPTNLSDEVKDIHPVLGDLVVCAPVVKQEAETQKKQLEAHWAHMTIHGVLHLLGYDHQKNTEAEKMEALEIELLQQLGFSNPYENEAL